MPAASSGGVYGDGVSSVAAVDPQPGVMHQQRDPGRAGTGNPDDVDALAGPHHGRRRLNRGRVRRPSPRPGPAPGRPARLRPCCRRGRGRRGGAPRASGWPRSATPIQCVPTGLPSLPPSGPATPVTARPSSVPNRWLTPSAMAAAHSAETAPCSAISAAGTAELHLLGLVRVADHPAREVVGRAGHHRDRVADQPTGRGLGHGHAPAGFAEGDTQGPRRGLQLLLGGAAAHR